MNVYTRRDGEKGKGRKKGREGKGGGGREGMSDRERKKLLQ